jgi:aflatoxin B1 aldehyde reductase
VPPTAYQGNYSAVARVPESELLPTLRKLGIAFYAYSPLAGGFLTKTKEDIEAGAGRFNDEAIGGMYKHMYGKESLISILPKWAKIAEDVGATKAELAYRWVAYNSPLKPSNGDALIVGASSHKQLEQTLVGLEKGPLPESAVKAIDEIWEVIKNDAPIDNFDWKKSSM